MTLSMRKRVLVCLIGVSLFLLISAMAQAPSAGPASLVVTTDCWRGLEKVEHSGSIGFPACQCFLSFPASSCGSDCRYIEYVDVIDQSTGEIMSIFGPDDFFGDNGIVEKGVVTSDGDPWAVSDGYAIDTRHNAELFVRREGTATVLYLCSPYANRFMLKVWYWNPTTCKLETCYIVPEGPCLTGDSSADCTKPHFGAATLWLVLDRTKLASYGGNASALLDEITEALKMSYRTVDQRIANEAAVGKEPWELTASDWRAGDRTYAEIRVRTEDCLNKVISRIRTILARYGLSVSQQDRRAVITTP